VTDSRTSKPQTTFVGALTALAVCVGLIAFVMALSTASGWLANPALGPHSALEAAGAFAFVFGLWALNVGVVFATFAGIPWAILHFIGLRSWWIAPLAGFLVAFAIAYFTTKWAAQTFAKFSHKSWSGSRARNLGLTPCSARSPQRSCDPKSGHFVPQMRKLHSAH
jgi:hypothetical protein